MHAHRCEACAAKGKEVVWIHPEADFNQVSSHRCPECGTVNWKQSKIDNAKLPAPLPRNGNKLETAITWSLILIIVALFSYAGYLYWQKIKKEKMLAE